MDESYISEKVDRGLLSAIPVSFGRTFSYRQQDTVKILAEQQNIIREIAKRGEDFVIVGRNADVILAQYHPFRIFVYADMESKLNRCKEREELEDLAKRIRQVDKGRAKNRELLSGSIWGRKENYDLCVNTSGVVIKEIVPLIAEYADLRFKGER